MGMEHKAKLAITRGGDPETLTINIKGIILNGQR